jgi:putative hydrolase of the HAD superfamily
MKPDPSGIPPSVLCFDATGTLIELRESVGEVYHRAALEHGVRLPAWRLEDAFRRVLRHAPPLGTEGGDPETRQANEQSWWAERIRQTFQATDSTARFADFPAFAYQLFEAFASGALWRVRPGIPELLHLLAGRGHPMAVISNFDHRLLKILEVLDLVGFFEAVFLPAQVGAAKPERSLFDAAAKHFDVPIERLTYLGDDSEEDLRAIAAHGLCALDIRKVEALSPLPEPIERAATL